MPVVRTLKCPSCDGEFDELLASSDSPPPRFCKLCGYDTQAKPKRGRKKPAQMQMLIGAPAIRSRRTKGIDDHRKASEEGAQHRVNVAREMGLDADQADTLKLSNVEAGVATAHSNGVVGSFANTGQSFAQAAGTGPFPRTGVAQQERIRQIHGANHPGLTTEIRHMG